MKNKMINAVGVCFFCHTTNRYLYLLRNDARSAETWGLVGGKIEGDETLLSAIVRECIEEIGMMPNYDKITPIERFTSADGKFVYNTFFCKISEEFIPVLNDEHCGYAWIQRDKWPKPLHPGLWNTVNIQCIKEKLAVAEKL